LRTTRPVFAAKFHLGAESTAFYYTAFYSVGG
jgi:hypothetical protein